MAGRRRHSHFRHSAYQESFAHRVSTVVRRRLVGSRRSILYLRLAACPCSAEYPRPVATLPPPGRVPVFGRLATLPVLGRFPAPALGRLPGVGKLPIDWPTVCNFAPPLGLRTFEVVGRDIDGVREATLRDPPPLPLPRCAPPPPRRTATTRASRHRHVRHHRRGHHRHRRHAPPPPPLLLRRRGRPGPTCHSPARHIPQLRR